MWINCLRYASTHSRVAQPTPWTENTFFAKSIPTVETKLMGLPLSKRLISQLNPGTSVPPRDGEVPYIR